MGALQQPDRLERLKPSRLRPAARRAVGAAPGVDCGAAPEDFEQRFAGEASTGGGGAELGRWRCRQLLQ
eukprot:5467750-Prymnesium_polylepis.1